MLDLLLDVPAEFPGKPECWSGVSFELKQQHAKELVLALQRLLGENSGEAKLWLVSSVAALSLPASESSRRFAAALSKGDFQNRRAVDRLLSIFVEHQPDKTADVLLQDTNWIKHYFSEDTRAVAWFSHFGRSDISGFKFGSKALAEYVLQHRNTAWEHLVWQGSQGHSPVVVTSKPFYLSQLDIRATLANLRTDCPQFWESRALLRSLKGGHFLAGAPEFFVKTLRRVLGRDDQQAEELWRQLCILLRHHPYQRLCQALLPELDSLELSRFCQHLLPPLSAEHCQGASKTAIRHLLFGTMRWSSLEELRLYSALGLQERQLRRLLQENRPQAMEIQGLAEKLCSHSPGVNWAYWAEAFRMSPPKQSSGSELWSLLLLQRWAMITELSNLQDIDGFRELLAQNKVILEFADREPQVALDAADDKNKSDRKRSKKRKREMLNAFVSLTISSTGDKLSCQFSELPEQVSNTAFVSWARSCLNSAQLPID